MVQPIHLLSGLHAMAAEELRGSGNNQVDPQA